MKKLLNIIGASVILSSSAVVASCSLDPSAPIEINDAIDLQNFFNKLQNNRPELSSDYNVAFDGKNAKYIAALEEIFDQEKVVRTPFIQKLLKADFYDNDKSTIGYDIQKTGQVLGGGSLVRGADHKVIPDVANKKLSDYFYEKVAKPDEKPVVTTKPLTDDLTVTSLGTLADKSESTIKVALSDKNKNLNLSQVTITNITDIGAKINVIENSTVYDAGGSVSVTFMVTPGDTRQELSEVVATLGLGKLADKEPTTILAAINEVNSSSLTDADVTIEATSDTEATVTPKEDSKLVKGDAVTVTFEIGTDDKTVALDTIITDPKLGEIATADEAGVKAALADKYSDLNQDEITIAIGEDGLSATIAAKDGSTVYSGSVEVTFTLLDTRQELSEVVATLGLGKLADKEPTTILAAINEVNSSSLTDADVTIEATSDTEATVTPKEDSKLVKGDAVTVTFEIGTDDKTVALDTIITDPKLGEIATADEAGVKAALADKYSDLNQDEITIAIGEDGLSATIAAKDGSTVYSGSVEVTFTLLDTRQELSEVVATLGLGKLADKESATILAAINEVNSSSLTDADVTIEATSDTEATVTPKEDSKLVKGDAVTVTFEIGTDDKTVALDTIITDPKLGEIATADEVGVKAALADKYSDLNQDEITIAIGEDGLSATIAAKDGSTVYSGSVEVTFTVTAPSTMNYYSILNMQHLLNDGPEYSYDDYTMTIMIGSEELFNLDNNEYVYIPFTILPK
jgi:hypothetical protein